MDITPIYESRKLIHDSIHGYMTFDETCLQIIDTLEFQRLRNLKQLGAAVFVFPCAIHSRFEHSLGVAHLSEKLMLNIKDSQPELKINERQIQLIKIAALIHDLGHGCYSHFFDNIFLNSNSPNKFHEMRSINIFKNMISKYSLPINNEELEIIRNIIIPDSQHTNWYYQIVSNSLNGLDTDKLDYLQRDTKNLGLPYSIDSSRILMETKVIDGILCYPDKEIYSIFEIFHTRYRLHKQIYTHPCIQQIEYMILDILNYADPFLNISQSIDNMENFIKITDNIIDFIEFSNNKDLVKSINLIIKLKTRNLYSFINEINYNKDKVKKYITKEDFKEKDPSIDIDLIIVHHMTIGYNGISEIPLKNIFFYSHKDCNKSFKCEKNKISRLLPKEFEENLLRVFTKDNSINDKVQKIFNELINEHQYI